MAKTYELATRSTYQMGRHIFWTALSPDREDPEPWLVLSSVGVVARGATEGEARERLADLARELVALDRDRAEQAWKECSQTLIRLQRGDLSHFKVERAG